MNAASFFHVDLATILNLVSMIVIVGAVIFTALQVRQSNRSQRDQAAVAMMKTVMRDTLTDPWRYSLNCQRMRNRQPEIFRMVRRFADRIGERRRMQRGLVPAHKRYSDWRE